QGLAGARTLGGPPGRISDDGLALAADERMPRRPLGRPAPTMSLSAVFGSIGRECARRRGSPRPPRARALGGRSTEGRKKRPEKALTISSLQKTMMTRGPWGWRHDWDDEERADRSHRGAWRADEGARRA